MSGVFQPAAQWKAVATGERKQRVADVERGFEVYNPGRADPRWGEQQQLYRWARKRILDLEKWTMKLVQFIDDGL
jgi:hypothetical protein